MKINVQRRRWVIVVLAAVLGLDAAQASPGRTNRRGCHKSKREGFHCHRGQTRAAPGDLEGTSEAAQP